jgi:hypothetical protein
MAAHHRCHLCKGGFCTGAHACAHRCFHLRSSFFTLRCLTRYKHFSHHGAVKPYYGPLGMCCGAMALADQAGQRRRRRPDTCHQLCPGSLWETLLLAKRTPESGASDLNFRLRRLRTESRRTGSGPRSAKPDLVRQSPSPQIRRQRLQVRQLERSMKIVSLRLRTSSSNRRSQGA